MRTMASTLALALALGLAGAGTAAAAEGTGLIQRVDALGRSVVLDGVAFRVDDTTRIRDAEGEPLVLEQLPSLEQGAEADQAAAWYEAGDARHGEAPLLRVLRLTGSVPK